MRPVGTVSELWRYPVKSLGGESLPEVRCDARGVDLDRWWSVCGTDGKLGSGKTTRRFRRMPGLLTMSSYVDGDSAVVRFADGTCGDVNDQLTAERVGGVVGEPVTLPTEGGVRHLDDGAIHLLTTSSLRWLRNLLPETRIDVRRFRPNIVIESAGSGLEEDQWVGRRLVVGDVTMNVERRAVRCVMAALEQEDLPFAPAVVRELEQHNDLYFGVYATADAPGTLRVGDEVRVAG